MCWLVLTWLLKDHLKISVILFCIDLSLWFCPVPAPISLALSSRSLTEVVCLLCLSSSFLYHSLETLSRQKKKKKRAIRIHLIFSSLMDDYPFFPLSNVLKFIVPYNLPIFLVILGKMVNLVPLLHFGWKHNSSIIVHEAN